MQGRTACQQDGGDLAVFETLELHDFVKANFVYVLKLISFEDIFIDEHHILLNNFDQNC